MCSLPIKVHPLTTIITATAGESMPSRNRSADTISQTEIAKHHLGHLLWTILRYATRGTILFAGQHQHWLQQTCSNSWLPQDDPARLQLPTATLWLSLVPIQAEAAARHLPCCLPSAPWRGASWGTKSLVLKGISLRGFKPTLFHHAVFSPPSCLHTLPAFLAPAAKRPLHELNQCTNPGEEKTWVVFDQANQVPPFTGGPPECHSRYKGAGTSTLTRAEEEEAAGFLSLVAAQLLDWLSGLLNPPRNRLSSIYLNKFLMQTTLGLTATSCADQERKNCGVLNSYPYWETASSWTKVRAGTEAWPLNFRLV